MRAIERPGGWSCSRRGRVSDVKFPFARIIAPTAVYMLLLAETPPRAGTSSFLTIDEGQPYIIRSSLHLRQGKNFRRRAIRRACGVREAVAK